MLDGFRGPFHCLGLQVINSSGPFFQECSVCIPGGDEPVQKTVGQRNICLRFCPDPQVSLFRRIGFNGIDNNNCGPPLLLGREGQVPDMGGTHRSIEPPENQEFHGRHLQRVGAVTIAVMH